MKKFIASAVAAATAFTATVPLTATAATITPDADAQCRVQLNDAERGPASQAERIAKTLTHGMYATAVVEAFEATFPGLKLLGDDHLTQPAITTVQEIRLANDEPGAHPDYDGARAATKAKLAKLGLVSTDADFYLDMKQGAQIPLGPAGTALSGTAHWFVGIDGAVPEVTDLGPDYTFGNAGENAARNLRHVPDWKRDAFASNLNKTYFGQASNALESRFYYPLAEATKCHEGVTHVIFPANALDIPDAPVLNNTLPGESTPVTEQPAPERPAPERPDTFDAKLAEVIGIIAAVLTALGALFALLKTAGFNVPDLPKIPGLNK